MVWSGSSNIHNIKEKDDDNLRQTKKLICNTNMMVNGMEMEYKKVYLGSKNFLVCAYLPQSNRKFAHDRA